MPGGPAQSALESPGQRSLTVAHAPQADVVANFLGVGALGLCYILVSSGLIAYNKYLMHEDRFPFAVPLVTMHMGFCSTLTLILYFVKPSLFPSLTDPERRVVVDRRLMSTVTLPIAVCFAGQLTLSNTAYLHCSLAFLQMMKEANLVLVYVLSLAFLLERFEWRTARILILVGVATALTIHGELHFSLVGFIIQASGQVFESVRIVLQSLLLSSKGKKLDALSYVLLVCPICFFVLGCAWLLLVFVLPNEHLMTPHWSHIQKSWPHLVANACIAFTLNVVIALFVKYSSAVSFILAGIVKDAMIVFAGVMLLKEVISPLQCFGFGLQLSGILLYSLHKTHPEKFEDGIFPGLAAVLCGPREAPEAPAGTLARRPAGDAKDYGSVESGDGTKEA